MNNLKSKVADLRDRMEQAVDREQRLAAHLQEQERALLGGSTDEIHAANHALDQVYDDLRKISKLCRESCDELIDRGDLRAQITVKDVINQLPDEFKPEVEAARRRLRRARTLARRQSSRNATIARTSLDAIASVRGILSQASAGVEDDPHAASPMSRLDARV